MITLVYVHDHVCSQQGEEIKVYPNIHDGTYVQTSLMCIEANTELSLSKRLVD